MDVVEYAKGIVARLPEASTATNVSVAIGGWRPRPKNCYDNVRLWVQSTPAHKHVIGYVIFDYRHVNGCWRVQAHSLVEWDDGGLVDITPAETSKQHPFVRHTGTGEEFREMMWLIAVDVPAHRLEEL
jgi:hypothetical protein